ncbi:MULTISPECIES: hypothetical protein [Marinomonas]|uniref:SPOR domain-containing protein n=2 Tax=Marinomonas TaxID=28253 RepID=A0ABT3KD71_9GAMM|nr:hypothetical protein [Marinomonas sp. KJ51-3]MCW4628481.1 hypothetical protein [Marinomonas sp. KJ51-3]
MRKFFFAFLVLLLVGIGLSLLLPKPQPSSQYLSQQTNYTISQDSLFAPLPMTEFLLITPTPNDVVFTLRLGLYSQLQQAVNAAESMDLSSKAFIVKVVDNNREWYLLLFNQHPTAEKAEQQKRVLENQKISATLMLLPKDLKMSKS